MKVLATAVAVVLAGAVLAACGEQGASAPPSATSTAVLTAQQSGMADKTRNVITTHAAQTGGKVRAFGPPQFPTDLQVVMWADVTASGNDARRTWFKVSFLGAGDSIVPYGAAKIAPSENGPWV